MIIRSTSTPSSCQYFMRQKFDNFKLAFHSKFKQISSANIQFFFVSAQGQRSVNLPKTVMHMQLAV